MQQQLSLWWEKWFIPLRQVQEARLFKYQKLFLSQTCFHKLLNNFLSIGHYPKSGLLGYIEIKDICDPKYLRG